MPNVPNPTPGNNSQSLTDCIQAIGNAGDDSVNDAVNVLWNHFFERLESAIKVSGELAASVRATRDVEDIALSAFKSAIFALQKQKYPGLDREGFWRLLFTIAKRKAINATKAEKTVRRGGEKRFNESQLILESEQLSFSIDQAPGMDQPPEQIATFAEEVKRILNYLIAEDGGSLSSIVKLLLLGYKHKEIAVELELTDSIVEYKIRQIRLKLKSFLKKD